MLMGRVRRSLRARTLRGSRWLVPVQQPSPLVAAPWLPRTPAASDAAALLAQALAAAELHSLPPWVALLDSRSGPFTVCKLHLRGLPGLDSALHSLQYGQWAGKVKLYCSEDLTLVVVPAGSQQALSGLQHTSRQANSGSKQCSKVAS